MHLNYKIKCILKEAVSWAVKKYVILGKSSEINFK